MILFKGKGSGDYNLVFYYQRQSIFTLRYADGVLYGVNWFNRSRNYRQWDHVIVYVRRTGKPLCYYSNGEFLPMYPTYENRGRFKSNWIP